jgi:signal transduction histidine kinase
MWFATPTGLTAFKDGTWRTFKADALPSEDIDTLLVDSKGVLWIGTENGLAFWRAGRITPVNAAVPGLHERVLGIAEDRKGSLWISTSNHFLRLDREKLLRGNITPEDVREFTTADGLRGNEGVKRSQSVVSDSEGRIWFSTNRGISVIDPGRFSRNAAPAIAHVQTLSADGQSVALTGPIHIAGGLKRLTVEFGGLSLSVPERVRFRYMLEGFDTDWSNPVAGREAVYTNLAPAAYRFRVIASNPDGVWNSQEESLAFSVDPRLWQTWWFRLALVLAAGVAALVLYRLRLQQLTRRLNLRFEERLAERTRIAQELHDTLLQGFLSASMQVHVANDGLPEDARVKPILVRALDQMGQVINEGRTAVRGLRASKSASLDLEEAFSLVREEFGSVARKDVDFRVVADGVQRHMNPLLRDEVYRIGREALLNAFRHSNARHIELELRYLPRQLQMFVRDDGSGIDSELVKTGREGHFGLAGMREKAEKIGAQFHVFRRPAGGTEVELTVPGRYAFLQSGGERKWLARWRN